MFLGPSSKMTTRTDESRAEKLAGTRRLRGRRTAGILAVMAFLLLWAAPVARASNDECLACHGPDTGLTNSQGKAITVNPAPFARSVHKDLGCVDCHAGAAKFPHDAKSAGTSCLACHGEEGEHVSQSAHGALGSPQTSQACIACHSTHAVEPPAARGVQLCQTCHAQEVKGFAASVHGQARAGGNGSAPSCENCHRSAHQVLAADAPNSPVNKVNLPETCGKCHSNPEFMQKFMFAVAKPVEAYESSVHGKAVKAGRNDAAACNDCHGVHEILAPTNPQSMIAPRRVASTCGHCHKEEFSQYKDSIHGKAVAAGVRGAPTCIDCHGEHRILAPSDPGSPVYVANISTLTCSRCHEDQQLLTRLDIPAGRVVSYENSFHGLAAKAGSHTVANCASCHGVHNILPSSDPRSTVNKANLPATCGKCHPDAGKRFAIGPIHVLPTSVEGHKILYYVRLFYLFTIPTVVGFMLLHNLLDWWRKARRRLAQYRMFHTPIRLTLSERVQHVLLLVSFISLVITGFVLKFPDSFWAEPFVRWESEFAFRGLIHRIAAVVLIAAAVYHVLYLFVAKDGRRWVREMLPKVRDVRDAVHTVGHNLGYRPTLPSYPRFNYAEKVEYWALVWGTVVMVATGVMLWAHNLMLEYVPKWVLDVATAIHYYEAILATLAIVIWHFYAVIFDPDVYPLKWTFLTGRAPEHELREEETEPNGSEAHPNETDLINGPD
jgi:formate dehydrogenase gamma subunit